jgi:hypothetical protein
LADAIGMPPREATRARTSRRDFIVRSPLVDL